VELSQAAPVSVLLNWASLCTIEAIPCFSMVSGSRDLKCREEKLLTRGSASRFVAHIPRPVKPRRYVVETIVRLHAPPRLACFNRSIMLALRWCHLSQVQFGVDGVRPSPRFHLRLVHNSGSWSWNTRRIARIVPVACSCLRRQRTDRSWPSRSSGVPARIPGLAHRLTISFIVHLATRLNSPSLLRPLLVNAVSREFASISTELVAEDFIVSELLQSNEMCERTKPLIRIAISPFSS